MAPTISLGMIVRNEGRTLEAALDSVAPFVDQIVIGLAGESTDDTENIAKNHTIGGRAELDSLNDPTADKIVRIEWTEDFSAARNQVMKYCTGDYFLWIDGDDVLVGGEKLREYIDKFPQVDAFYMGYDYARDENGLNTCFLIRERLIKRHPELDDWNWIGKVHEVLRPNFQVNGMHVQDVVVRHFKPPNKHSPDRNLKILYAQLAEQEPNPDPRILGYLGSENSGRGNFTEAIVHWQRFVKLSGWDEEKYQVQVKISHAHRALGQIDRALGAAYSAIAILPHWPDAYLALAKAYSSEPLNDYRTALEWCKIAASKEKPATMLIINPLEYTYELSLMIALCYTQLGDYEMALANYKNSYEVVPDPTVASQMAELKEELNQRNLIESFLQLREYLGRNDEWLKVNRLFDAVPRSIQEDKRILEAWDRTIQQTAHIDNPQVMVDFYRQNPHWESMSEEKMMSSDWLTYPRMAFALRVAEGVSAENVLDLGCSDGFISLPLARETGAKVTGFDLDPRCVDLANERAEKYGLDAHFEVGNLDDYLEENNFPEGQDLALLFEVLEHVVDPQETLGIVEKTSRHVAITTPYMAWEKGNIPAWDRVEPKGHLRIFDLKDIEVLLTGRGKINNLYREEWGQTGWIFADYEVGQETDKNVVIYAPASPEQWGPKKLGGTGLGGSETAVIRVAEELARNHRVFVYNWIDEPGYYSSVCYRDREQFAPSVRTDLFIAWRSPEAADFNVNAGKRVLWMHDTDAGDRLTEQRAQGFDSIVVLSEWHKNFMKEKYPFIPDEKLVVIGNGVDPGRFDEPITRNTKKVVYSSSPDRGLDIILEHIWPKVIEQVPEAELHLYYGWDNFEKFMNRPGFEFMPNFRNYVMNLLVNSKNVTNHGRIPQDRLAKEMQEAAVWLYPTYFTETYCITAVEAQLAGAIPITNHLAALQETVKSGIIIEGDVRTPEVQLQYVEAVISSLKYPNSRLHYEVKEKVHFQSWSIVAQLWEDEFLGGQHGRSSDLSPNGAERNIHDNGSRPPLLQAVRMPNLQSDTHLEDVPHQF